MTFSERLDLAMRNAKFTQGRLAKEVGMAQSSVNQLLNKANGSRKTVEIAKVLGVNPEWLASGVGPME
ncbi:helix-turn-helix transcriptional regulator, partial [Escherichia coli]|nr:helix-turn-helix transcriptional regulator [Escherichia coli]